MYMETFAKSQLRLLKQLWNGCALFCWGWCMWEDFHNALKLSFGEWIRTTLIFEYILV